MVPGAQLRLPLPAHGSGGGDEWVHARIAREVSNNAFVIQTSAPQTRVSWQVTGTRQDAWLKHTVSS